MTVNYDAVWTNIWGDMQDIGPVHRHTARIIVETTRTLAVRSVLDVGCGNGANLEALQRALGISDVTGVDLSAVALDSARRRVRGEFRTMDLERDGPLDRTFDLVLTSQVIEHVHDDDAFLRKLRAMCGKYVFVGSMQGRMRPSEVHIGHLRNYTRAGLEEKMSLAGFAIEKVIEWGFPFYSPLYRSAIEHIGGQVANVGHGRRDRMIANILYHLYKLNSSSHGDVLMILGRAV
jgi:SAM-dependent methyltransferase